MGLLVLLIKLPQQLHSRQFKQLIMIRSLPEGLHSMDEYEGARLVSIHVHESAAIAFIL